MGDVLRKAHEEVMARHCTCAANDGAQAVKAPAPGPALAEAGRLLLASSERRLQVGMQAAITLMRERADDLERAAASDALCAGQKAARLATAAGNLAMALNCEVARCMSALSDLHAAEVAILKGQGGAC